MPPGVLDTARDRMSETRKRVRPRKLIVAKRMRRWAEATEAYIVGQSGKQTKIDTPSQ
jgi:hypothetical protein